MTTDPTTTERLTTERLTSDAAETTDAGPGSNDAATAPASSAGDSGTPGRGGIRMTTVVLGLVLLAVATTVLAARLSDIRLPPGVVLVALLVGSGLLLLAGALPAVRSRRGGTRH